MPTSYSVNQLKTWHQCQRKYEFQYVHKLAWPANPKNFRLGKGVHQLLDYEAKGLPIAPLVASADTDIVSVWRQLSASSWANLPVLESEWGFSLALDHHWIYGRIDRIAHQTVNNTQSVLILDWKTGTSVPLLPEEDWQTLIYLYAVYEAQRDLGITLQHHQLSFNYVYLHDGVVDAVTILNHPEKHHQTQRRLLETMEMIEKTVTYRLPLKCPDAFCPYRTICGIEKRTAQPSLSTITNKELEECL